MSDEKGPVFLPNTIIQGRFKLLEKIGHGSFGVVIRGLDMENNLPVALKLERVGHHKTRIMLENEYKAYCMLDGGPGIPKIFWFGLWKASDCQDAYYVLVMELLGTSLNKQLASSLLGQSNLYTVLKLAVQIMDILDFFHSKFMVHRDIKPANFVMGNGLNCDKVYMIDFGLTSTCAEHSPQGKIKHIPSNKSHLNSEVASKINGSLKYCSINAHYGRNQSRRDDVESIGYMLILLYNGSLPWSKVAKKYRPDDAIKIVLDMKLAYEPSKDIVSHESLTGFLQMARALSFDEIPNYKEWKAKFQEVLSRLEVPGKYPLERGDPSYLDESNILQLTSSSSSSVQAISVKL